MLSTTPPAYETGVCEHVWPRVCDPGGRAKSWSLHASHLNVCPIHLALGSTHTSETAGVAVPTAWLLTRASPRLSPSLGARESQGHLFGQHELPSGRSRRHGSGLTLDRWRSGRERPRRCSWRRWREPDPMPHPWTRCAGLHADLLSTLRLGYGGHPQEQYSGFLR